MRYSYKFFGPRFQVVEINAVGVLLTWMVRILRGNRLLLVTMYHV